MNKKRFYIHCGDDINKQLMDTESDFNIHVEEIGSDEELIRLCNLLNEQQATIEGLKEENDDLRFALRTEQAFTRVEKDKKPFLSKEEFLKELEEDE